MYSFTVNHQSWDGTGDVYIIAVVEMVEQQGLRLVTNIIGIDPEDVRIGMSVEVVFEDHDPVYLPLFRPVAS
ncbi:Zn-ribbon domain-containing OB-fold protein [Mycobacterium sp. 1274761.0]|uniref:Zn-ribbon domain-containing OB-fold protein n=1 Tax=Mycobacterium sp. 1274761.0 TaxID=1834077 RepID=UPI001E3A2AA5|nr:OB-fold domain-containing protein [Mycobacterium sp. 1274761.0]